VIRFHQPTALIGLAAALVPIIIYLLLRRRRSEVPWGASYLLRLTLASRRKTSRWKQFVVLAVRTLVLALVAALLARPWSQNPNPTALAPQPPEEPVHRVVLVDNSLSMSLSEGGDSRMARLRAALAPLLASQRKGDTTTLIALAPGSELQAGPAVITDPISERQVARIVSGLSLREGAIELRTALTQAFSSLSTTPEAAAELYILSDFPRELADQFGRINWFREAARQRRLRVVPVSMTSPDAAACGNVAILSVRIGADRIIARIPTAVYVELENFSDSATLARLRFALDGEERTAQGVPLQPNERKRVAVGISFPKPGNSVLRVRVDQSRLGARADVHYSVDVVETPQVWVYADEAGPRSEHKLAESQFLVRALRGEGGKPPLMDVVEVGTYELAQAIPPGVGVVILAGPRVITPRVGQNLAAFVRRGGGLIVAMSPGLDVSFYNENLAGLMPARLLRPLRDEIDPQLYVVARREPARGAAELFSEFATDRSGELGEVRFYNHMLLQDAEGVEGVVFRLTNDDPLLVHGSFGRGHVYLFTSSLGVSWSSFAVRQSFIPLLYRLINAAMRGGGFPRNLRPGEPFIAPWDAPGPAMLETPGGVSRMIEPTPGPQKSFIVVDGVSERGIYTLRDPAGRVETFTVTGRSPEADLRTLTEKQGAELADLLGQAPYPNWSAAVRALGPADAARELWPLLLMAICALYLFETWFVRYL